MPRPSPTRDECIRRFKKAHGDRYDYSKFEYKGHKKQSIIICKIHGPFKQVPHNHWAGNGCHKCGKISQLQNRTMTKEEFIIKSSEIHNNFYSYEKVNFINQKTHINITCPKHGTFIQAPEKHLKGRGCLKCGREKMKLKSIERTLTNDQFKQRAKKIHKNLYDYSNSKYKTMHEKVEIICKKHGSFFQPPSAHLSGKGCKKCSIEFISGLKRNSIEELVKTFHKIHENFYDYSNFKEYKNNKIKIEIVCPEHGSFFCAPSNHASGKGCPKCFNKHEGRIARYLKKKHITWRQYNIGNKFYDFLLPEYNLLIERDGQQHYRDVDLFARGDKNYLKKQIRNDRLKTKIAKENGFKIARLPFWLSKKEEEIEIENILKGSPSFPDVPDIKEYQTKPKPKGC